MTEALRPLAEFEDNLGFSFADPLLLVHRSYLNEAGDNFDIPDNERLEFLGDSVLGFVAAELLFRRYPRRLEGELTNLRAALVRRETLARFAEELALGDFLLLGHGEEESGGRTRPATLCATFEAVIGAIYLDGGLNRVREFLEGRLTAEVERVAPSALAKDPKSRLQEWIQSELGVTPRYKTVLTEGPDHARFFTVQVSADKIPYGVGRGRSKQEAAQSAAAMALHHFDQPAPEYIPNPELEAAFSPAAPDES